MDFVFKRIISSTVVAISGDLAFKKLIIATPLNSPDAVQFNLTSLGLTPGNTYDITVVATATGIEESDHSNRMTYYG
jgi:hypothetical protein